MPIEERLTSTPGVFAIPGLAQAVVTSGRTAHISGQVPLDEDGNLVGAGDLRAQATQALTNLERVVKQLGATWHDVVRFTWFTTDPHGVQTIRDVRDEFLGDAPKPGSSLIVVAGLFHPDVVFEVEAVVALP
ncbi:RidA family protein [Actinocrispum sp. NPDC049592]|uniref:RidA family protein n=1 Tax=Actinocrispum sp. NPDC049592 TaxID=3154835 RepID=UPI0034202F6B